MNPAFQTKTLANFFFFVDCWNPLPQERPTFREILSALEEIKSSSFINTPRDSFHTMQADWKAEIEKGKSQPQLLPGNLVPRTSNDLLAPNFNNAVKISLHSI